MKPLQTLTQFLDSLDLQEFNPSDYIQDDFEVSLFDDLTEELEEQGAFSQDVIYYSVAIDYLANNDPSLQKSLDLAYEMGFTVDNLSSETLASLLASQNAREEWSEYEDEVQAFIDNLSA